MGDLEWLLEVVCSHPKPEQVFSEAGLLIGEICRRCGLKLGKRTCKHCGEELVGFARHDYTTCRIVAVACKSCGKEFRAPAWMAKVKTYCKPSCPAEQKRVLVTVTCEWCGRQRQVPKHHAHLIKFCDESCRHQRKHKLNGAP